MYTDNISPQLITRTTIVHIDEKVQVIVNCYIFEYKISRILKYFDNKMVVHSIFNNNNPIITGRPLGNQNITGGL